MTKKKTEIERIADALERLVYLKEIELGLRDKDVAKALMRLQRD